MNAINLLQEYDKYFVEDININPNQFSGNREAIYMIHCFQTNGYLKRKSLK